MMLQTLRQDTTELSGVLQFLEGATLFAFHLEFQL